MNVDLIEKPNENRNDKTISRSEFKYFFDSLIPQASSLEKTVDILDRIPSAFKALHNFDPSGVSSFIVDLLDKKKAQYDEKKNFEILYNFYLSLKYVNDKIDRLDGRFDEKVVQLTRAYFHYSNVAFHEELIIYFRNIWCNSIINIEDSSEEQIYMFNILSSLTPDSIKILRIIYDFYKSDMREELKVGLRGVLDIHVISRQSGFREDYARTICLSLVGNGLLIDANVNAFGNRADQFSLNNYFERFLSYVLQGPESI